MEINSFEVLKAAVPFNLLGNDVLLELAGSLEVKSYPKGSYVLKQGKLGLPVLFIIARGVAEVILTDDRNQETSISFRHAHDFFGITSVLTHKSYPASVRAVEDLTCILLPGENLEALMISHPTFSGRFTALLSERIRLLYKEVITQHSYESRNATESPLLRKRVNEIMTRSPITCHYSTPVSDVALIMKNQRVSSIIVIDDKDYPIGLVGEEALVHKVLTRSSWQTANLTAGMVMDEKLIKLQMEAFYNQALLAVIKYQVKHMVIMDGEKLVGILTLRDLINTRSTGSLWVSDKIETANDLDHLTQIGREVDDLLNALVAERASVPELFEIITEMHDRLTCRIIELCEQEMVQNGYGAPPVEYCWINMGSAGRKEQTLRTDQDNAIIYADGDDDHGDYFHILAARVVEELILAGFSSCKGDVMASNPRWCHSLGEWKKVIDRWVGREELDSVRMLTIFLDLRCVYGSHTLSRDLWEFIFEGLREPLGLTHYLAEDEIFKRVPLSMMGGFVTEKKGPHKNEINLKYVCRHIINCFRVFAVRHRITETSTLGRISRIVQKDILSREDGDVMKEAFETLMMLEIRGNLNKVKEGREADNYVNPNRLNKTEQLLLKGAFSAILHLQKITGGHFTDHARRVMASGV
jgi:CBS domain-containing protein